MGLTPWPDPTTLELGPETLAVYDYGPPPDGPGLGQVVMLHGMADVARSLQPLAEPLTDRYRVVLFDAQGHGRSSHPGAYSVLHYVADLHALLDQLRQEGVEVDDKVEESEYGRFGWIMDPDGNKIELWEPPDGS